MTKASERVAQWRERNPGKHAAQRKRAALRAGGKQTPAQKRAYDRYRERYPERVRTATREHMRRKMGLPQPTRPMPEFCERPGCTRKAANLDHDHQTGTFRGWLCRACNMAIGQLGDTIGAVETALIYLRRAQQ